MNIRFVSKIFFLVYLAHSVGCQAHDVDDAYHASQTIERESSHTVRNMIIAVVATALVARQGYRGMRSVWRNMSNLFKADAAHDGVEAVQNVTHEVPEAVVQHDGIADPAWTDPGMSEAATYATALSDGFCRETATKKGLIFPERVADSVVIPPVLPHYDVPHQVREVPERERTIVDAIADAITDGVDLAL